MENNKVNEIELYKDSPAALIRMAITDKADLDKLKKLLSLQERFEANEAKKAYHKAMAEFKANPPKIDKDKTVSYATNTGKTSYTHASLANVTEKINEALSKCGLSASWTTKQNGTISVTCKITHVKGHSEETTITAAADKSGSKNDIQAIGSTITYLERYTLLALTGLATSDMDDDGASVAAEFIGKEEINIILDNLLALNEKPEKLLGYLGVDSIEKILKKDYQKAIVAIEQKKKEIEKKKAVKK